MYLNYYNDNPLEFVEEQSKEEIEDYLKRLAYEYKHTEWSLIEDEWKSSEAKKRIKRNVEYVLPKYSMYFI